MVSAGMRHTSCGFIELTVSLSFSLASLRSDIVVLPEPVEVLHVAVQGHEDHGPAEEDGGGHQGILRHPLEQARQVTHRFTSA